MKLPPIILESFRLPQVGAGGMDALWARGWRHFGEEFFRYSIMEHQGGWEVVLPLRIDLQRFTLSKCQRRNLRRNADLTVSLRTAAFSAEAEAIFERHRTRFLDNVPDALENFLGPTPGVVPCACLELRCSLGGGVGGVELPGLGE